VGGGLVGECARQHPDLTDTSGGAASAADSVLRVVIFVLLAVDGVISAVLGAFFVQLQFGPVPFPVSAVLSGLLNGLLVWVGLQWTTSARWASTALWTWLLTVVTMSFWGAGGILATTFGGFFDDALFGGPGFDQFSPLVLLVLGVLPAAYVLARR
jgi:hypothetical protein